MALFNRQWFSGLQRMFPSSTQMLPYPRELTDTISFVKDVQAVDFVNNVRLRRSVVTGVGTGGSVLLDHPEPDQGFFQLPVAIDAWQNGATTLLASLAVIQTANPQDPWGAFETTSRQLDSGTFAPSVLGAGNLESRPFRTVWPVTRGFFLRVELSPVPGGELVRSHFYWVDVPGDVVKLDQFFRSPQLRG